MRDITCFSANVVNSFKNDYNNMLKFNELLINASRGQYTEYTKEETQKIIRNQMDVILGGNFAEMSRTQRRQAWRAHGIEVATLFEDVLIDKVYSGWDEADAKFLDFVEDKNLADGDTNEWYVEDASLLQVSKFAGDHHDVLRQAVKPGKAFSVETSNYVVKVYTDFEAFRMGKIDFAALVDRIYKSISKNRLDALYTAFLSLGDSLPTDLILETPLTEATKDSVIAEAEAVRAATGCDVMFVGTKIAISKLQNIVNYNIWSDSMKDEKNKNGVLANFEGYECLALPRVNKAGTRTEITDNSKIMIVPIDPEFKPIRRFSVGDIAYFESGMDGLKKDMTVDVEVAYEEGIGVVVNQLYGMIKIRG